MSRTLKKILGVLLSVFILSIAYYGSYLPLNKSEAFISALRSVQNIRSLADFEQTFSVPLNMPSPIGQEELVRNTANIVLNIVQQSANPDVIEKAIDFIESYYNPIIDRGRGMSFEQNLYILGAINESAFVKTKQARFLRDSEKYYREGLELGPKRPQFLYGLFDVYRIEGNVDGAKAIAAQILSQWPTDDRIESGLNEFLNAVLTKSK
jgi:hypothetical protein